ncbi:hypothetical protein [Cohaesibacter gelatinilyticus]|uniref:Uncharacterized protein n=1 Tax=Cohaesibacter gelatinilyticus TaxID=372072 RepID=A0A285PBZ4_9HYPH|nr:hypothetical protein [Cohaesibacter gelatinilyticus]SNZ19255.1 hypothetical protein SAMN06265368_2335 [Cohaesibacter gelatinilyticus]
MRPTDLNIPVSDQVLQSSGGQDLFQYGGDDGFGAIFLNQMTGDQAHCYAKIMGQNIGPPQISFPELGRHNRVLCDKDNILFVVHL